MEYEIVIKPPFGKEDVLKETYESYEDACRANLDVALSGLRAAACDALITIPLACSINFMGNRIDVKFPAGIITVEVRQKINDIMDTSNGHNPELVRKINDAWKVVENQHAFQHILYAILMTHQDEYEERIGDIPEDADLDYAWEHAHEIMQSVCDDRDLDTILSFIRYEE